MKQRAKEIFRHFDRYPSTKNDMDLKAELGSIDGKDYWEAYNEHYGTNYTIPIETVRL